MSPIGNPQIKLLEKLCNASAVSGDEGEVRQIITSELKGCTDQIQVDPLGNLLVRRSGPGRGRKRVMLSSHMDEVGFMLVADEGEGIFRFETVGGLDVRQLPGKPVLVGREHIPGVIGARPIHLTTAEERRKAIPLDQLRIDTGPGKNSVRPGEHATFATRFQRSGSAILAKALDNRLGVSTLIELVRNAPEGVELLAAFTVQEEIGGRGAKVAAHTFAPDLAIALDATPANDLPAWDGEENVSYNTCLGSGPAIYTADGSTLSDPRLVRWLAASGEKAKIPFQLRQPGGGGTDAGMISRSLEGIPSVSVSIPHRYSHTALSIARLDDWKNTFQLLLYALEHLRPNLLVGSRA